MTNWLNNVPSGRILLTTTNYSWDKEDLLAQINSISCALLSRKYPLAPIGILADNSPYWLAADLACSNIGVTIIPIPTFFTKDQINHTILESGIHSLLTSDENIAFAFGFKNPIYIEGNLQLFESNSEYSANDLLDVQKITFTSGTTSEPKGVCLSSNQQWRVAESLYETLSFLKIKKHLTLLPFAVLLENVAGAYVSLLMGAENICLPIKEVGLKGASQFDPILCIDLVSRYKIESLILLPQMLQAIVNIIQKDDERIKSLKFIAVGGAKTPISLIKKAKSLGLPIFEGYGLSECSSVTTLNTPKNEKIGSVGKALPNRNIRISKDGEIEINQSIRYLGLETEVTSWLKTGDLGRIDDEGYLFINGRKKNILITSYGRNISPEWPESLILGTGLFSQALVVGDDKPHLSAILVPISNQIPTSSVTTAIDQINKQLPDYAQIKSWFTSSAFTLANNLATANGRLKREQITSQYALKIESLYETAGV